MHFFFRFSNFWRGSFLVKKLYPNSPSFTDFWGSKNLKRPKIGENGIFLWDIHCRICSPWKVGKSKKKNIFSKKKLTPMFFQNIIKIWKKKIECKFLAYIGHNLGIFIIFSEIGTILGTKTLKNTEMLTPPLQFFFRGGIFKFSNFRKLNGWTKKQVWPHYLPTLIPI